MPALMMFLIIAGIFVLIVGGIVVAPAISNAISSRNGELRKELADERAQKRIAVKALRDIKNDGGNAYLIADLALEDIERQEYKELN